jgi:putative MATE family efflux protein
MSALHDSATKPVNPFLTVPVRRLFLMNALPMAMVMSMGGVLNIVDGIFVGRYIGSDALAAVSVTFPAIMLMNALATLVGGGMSSLFARSLGAGNREEAGRIFAGAHGLAFVIPIILIGLYFVTGRTVLQAAAAGNLQMTGLADEYLRVLVFALPVQFLLTIHADALRNEGRAPLIALLSVLVNLFNIVTNYLAIVWFDLGVAGSALGTVLAQVLGLLLVVIVRQRDRSLLSLSALVRYRWVHCWRAMITVGLPLCLSFIGIALVSAVVMIALRSRAGQNYDVMVASYGIVIRILGFAFLPQMAIALATQSISGHNTGAGHCDRAEAVLKTALVTAFFWCLSVVLLLLTCSAQIGAVFTGDDAVVMAVGDILRPMMVFYVFSGPVLVLALYFQALGQPLRTAVLTLVKPWLLMPVFVFCGRMIAGTDGVWLAFPAADSVVLIVTVMIIFNMRKTVPEVQ